MQTVKFSSVIHLSTTRTSDPASAGIDRFVGLEHIEPENLHIRRWGLVADGTTFTNTFKRGQVLFGKRRAYQRKVAVADFDGVCSGDIYVFESKDPNVLLPELVPFIMQSEGFYQYAVKTSAGSLSPRTNWTHLANYELNLPPVDEQRRIADLLWAADDAIEKHKTVLESLEMLAHSFWKNIQDEKNYKMLPLKEVAKVSNGSTPSRAEKSYWENGTIPWLPTQKVNDRIITSANEFITELALKKCHLKIYPKGSVLIAMIGEGKTRGTAAYLEIDSCINQNFACIAPSEYIDSHYLFHCLDNSYERLRSGAQGGVHALNCKLVGNFEIPVPDIEEQRKFSEKFQQIEQQSQNIQKHIEILANLKKTLLQKFLQ
ncbi:restriction endonuclease subunit S [Chloroflexota bacterium]